MDVQRVLHMNGGDGETSYANNSLAQRLTMLKTKPFIEDAMQEVLTTFKESKSPINIADLGCAAGPNSLLATSMALDAALKCSQCLPAHEFQVFLNDLPANDFNSVFRKSLPAFYDKLGEEKGGRFAPPRCFVSATPGSFYGRLFPAESLHFFYSANSLHWLSQVPVKLGSLNKGNVCLGKSSPPAVFEAYLEQFQANFMHFLKLRSVELVQGGRMVLSMLARTAADPFGEECYHGLNALADALKDMVAEGIVEEDKLDSFNLPFYEPYIEEVRGVIQAEGSFDIIRLEALDRPGNPDSNEGFNMRNPKFFADCTRALTESMLTNHFGQTIMLDKLYEKFAENLLRGWIRKSTVLVASLAKKG